MKYLQANKCVPLVERESTQILVHRVDLYTTTQLLCMTKTDHAKRVLSAKIQRVMGITRLGL